MSKKAGIKILKQNKGWDTFWIWKCRLNIFSCEKSLSLDIFKDYSKIAVSIFSPGLTIDCFSFIVHSHHPPNNYHGIAEVCSLLMKDSAFL